jgi:hypothetical protein
VGGAQGERRLYVRRQGDRDRLDGVDQGFGAAVRLGAVLVGEGGRLGLVATPDADELDVAVCRQARCVCLMRPWSCTEKSEPHANARLSLLLRPAEANTLCLISTLCRVNGPLSVATIVVALVLAAWFLIRSAMDRPPSRFDLLATALLGVLVAVLVLVAVIGLFDGSRPAETFTFAGYLITTIAFAPAAFVLARMEPTRWGTLILGVACLVLPVLVLRLQQIASVTGG